MGKDIDEKVVSMRFDNKDFEKNTKTTMGTLQKLRESLKMSDSAKAFDGLADSIKKVSFDNISGALDGIKAKFSNLDFVAMAVIQNITNNLMANAKKWANAFTLEPVITGFKEYETQINAVQTILANTSSKGTTLEDVTAALDELNLYADKTIYNFTEMTKNIGTFTAAGVDLSTATAAIQGIANLAAVSGSNAQQAATAMYQLSQAMSSGTVKLMDWNSVVNAGMGGEVFQNALKETARLQGVAIDSMIEAKGSFRETLQEGWLTTEVLTKTLKKFTKSGVNEYLAENSDLSAEAISNLRSQNKSYEELGKSIAARSKLSAKEIEELIKMSDTAEDAATKVKTFTQLIDTMKEAVQSGWTQTWELIFGDFNQAKEFFTGLSDMFGAVIAKAADARNKLLGQALGVRQVTEDDWTKISLMGNGIKDFQNALKETAKEHGIAIDQIIKDEGSFKKSLKHGWLSYEILTETLKKTEKETENSTKNINEKLKEFEKLAKEVIDGDWANGVERKNKLTEAGMDYAQIQDIVNKMLSETGYQISELTDAELKMVGLTEEETIAIRKMAASAEEAGTPLNVLLDMLSRPNGRDLLIDSVMNTLEGMQSLLGVIGEAWRDAFPPMDPEKLYQFIDGVHNLTENFKMSDETAEKLLRTLKGVFAIADLALMALGGIGGIVTRVLISAFKDLNIPILDITASIGDSITAFRDWVTQNEYVTAAVEYVTDKLSDAGGAVRDYIKEVLGAESTEDIFKKIKSVTVNTFEAVIEHVKGGKEVWVDFIEYVKNIDEFSLDKLQEVFKKFFDDVIGYFIDLEGKFPDIQKGVAKMTGDVSKSFKKFMGKFGDAGQAVIDFTDTVNEKLSNIKWGNLLAIGTGIAILTVVIKIFKAFKSIADLISGFHESLTKITGAIAKLIKAQAFKAMTEGVRNLAIAIGILAASVWVLSTIPEDKLWGSIGAITALMAVLVAFTEAMTALDKGNLLGSVEKFGILVLTMAAGIFILVESLKRMEALDDTKILKNLGILGIMSATMALLAIAISKKAPTLAKGSFIFIALASSMLIMTKAIERLNDMDLQHLDQIIISLLTITASLSLLAIASKGMSIKAGVGVLAMTAALFLFVSAFEKIAALDMKGIKSNMEALVAVFGIFAVLMVSSGFAGANAAKGGAAILMASLSMIIIANAMEKLAAIDPNMLGKAMDAVRGILLVFAAIIVASSFAGDNAAKAGVLLLAMAGSLLVIGVVLTMLSNLEAPGLQNATLALAVISAFFVGLIGITAIAKTEKVLPVLITLVAAIAVMSVALGALSLIEPDNLTNASLALSMIMGMFGVLIGVSNLASTQGLLAIGVLTLVVAALGGVLYLLSGLPAEGTLKISEALSILLLSMSVSLMILAVLGAAIGAALVGIGLLVVFIAATLGMVVGIGALVKEFPMVEEFINVGIPILEKLGEGLGGFFGGIADGFLSGLSESFPKIGEDLGAFAKNAKPFFDAITKLGPDAGEGAKAMATAILALTGADMLQNISNFFFGSKTNLSDFGDELALFADGFVKFATKVSGFDETTMANAAGALKMVSSLAAVAMNLPNSGGLVSLFTGDNGLTDFGKDLEDFGPHFSNYVDSVKGIKPEHLGASTHAAKALGEFAKELPNSGGVVSWFTGNNSLQTFGQELAMFGPNFYKYAESVKDIKPEHVGASTYAAKTLAEFAGALPNGGSSLAKLIVGDNSIAVFGRELALFGPNLAKYVSSVKDVTPDDVAASTHAANMIAEFASALPNVSVLRKESDFSIFSSDMRKFGTNLLAFSTDATKINVAAVSSAINETTKLLELAKLMEVAEAGGLRNFNKITKGIASESINAFVQVFINSVPDINKAVFTMTNIFEEAITIRKTRIIQAVLGLSRDAVNALKSDQAGWSSAGAYAVDGYVNGINSNTNKVIAASKALAAASLEAMRHRLDERSPSKETYGIGDFAAVGYINALYDNLKTSYVAGKSVAEATLNGLNSAMMKANDLIDDDMSLNPVIKPVIDLTNVSAGVRSISNMLSSDRAIGVSTSVNENRRNIQNEQIGSMPAVTKTYEFKQYNYSPKALSGTEIYRNTRNLYARIKEGLL